MESLYLLVPLSVALVFLIGALFWRALDSGQFDDLDRASQELLADDDSPSPSSCPSRRPGSRGRPFR